MRTLYRQKTHFVLIRSISAPGRSKRNTFVKPLYPSLLLLLLLLLTLMQTQQILCFVSSSVNVMKFSIFGNKHLMRFAIFFSLYLFFGVSRFSFFVSCSYSVWLTKCRKERETSRTNEYRTV